VRRVGSGLTYYSRWVSEEVRRMVRGESGRTAPVPLTEREKRVLTAIAQGLVSKEISARLGMSVHAVSAHRSRLARKTGRRGTALLSLYAVELGLVGLSALAANAGR